MKCFYVFILLNTIDSMVHSSNKRTILFLDVRTSETKWRWFLFDAQTNSLTTVLLVPSVPTWWLRSIVTARLIPSFLQIMLRKSLITLHHLFHLNKNFRYFKNKVKLSIVYNLYFFTKEWSLKFLWNKNFFLWYPYYTIKIAAFTYRQTTSRPPPAVSTTFVHTRWVSMIVISYRPLNFLELYSITFKIISYSTLIYARLLIFRNKVEWNMLNPFLFFLLYATQSRPPSGGFCDEFRYRLSCQLIEWAAARECACLHCMLIDTGVLLPALLPGPVRSTGSVLQSHKQRLQLYGPASIKLVSEFLQEDWIVQTTIVVWFRLGCKK